MTSAQRDGLKDAVLALTEPMIDDLVKDISRRIKGAGAITETAEYQIYRLRRFPVSLSSSATCGRPRNATSKRGTRPWMDR